MLRRVIRPAAGGLSRALWRVRWHDTHHIPGTGGLVVACNHQTYADPFWVGARIERPARFLAWDESFTWPIARHVLPRLGAWPVRPESADAGAFRRSVAWLRSGGVLVIFPEGARATADGSMLPFRDGAVRLALEACVPILPVTIRGGHRVWPPSQAVPRLGRVDVHFHAALRVERGAGESSRAAARRGTERLTEVIGSGLG